VMGFEGAVRSGVTVRIACSRGSVIDRGRMLTLLAGQGQVGMRAEEVKAARLRW
jgi:hypothetical protein